MRYIVLEFDSPEDGEKFKDYMDNRGTICKDEIDFQGEFPVTVISSLP